jgi:hypothetical protein
MGPGDLLVEDGQDRACMRDGRGDGKGRVTTTFVHHIDLL